MDTNHFTDAFKGLSTRQQIIAGVFTQLISVMHFSQPDTLAVMRAFIVGSAAMDKHLSEESGNQIKDGHRVESSDDNAADEIRRLERMMGLNLDDSKGN